MRILRWIAGILLLAILVTGVTIKLIYGLGKPYPDLSTDPLRDDAIAAIELPLPPGMVTASPDGRIFFTYHPFHRPQDHAEHLIFEWRNGEAVPVGAGLGERLHGVFGITMDRQNQLWAVRTGAMEGRPTEVLALDPDSGEIVFEHQFAEDEAGFAQDLRVSPDGETVYLADTGLLRFTSAALIVLDIESRQSRTVLADHPSIAPQNWVMRRTDGSPYRLGYGLVNFQVGVDGLALSQDGEWLYYAAMTHESVYRVPTALLRDFGTSEAEIAAAIERLGPAPMSDGIELQADGSVVLTDVENAGLAVLSPQGDLSTLVRIDGVDWADSVTVAPNGEIWFTDSELTALLGPFGQPSSGEEMAAKAPFHIYRIPARAE